MNGISVSKFSVLGKSDESGHNAKVTKMSGPGFPGPGLLSQKSRKVISRNPPVRATLAPFPEKKDEVKPRIPENLDGLLQKMGKLKLYNLAKRSLQSIVESFKYPIGKDTKAIVLSMNPYVDDQIRHEYYPGELAIVCFSIMDGLDPLYYWTLIDPGDESLFSHGVDVEKNIREFGLPPRHLSMQTTRYTKIVEEMEALMKTALGTSDDTKFVFYCSQENIRSYQFALEWLYKKANRPFEHEIRSLETLVVVLSMGGLEAIEERSNNALDLPSAIATIGDLENAPPSRRQETLKKFTTIAGIKAADYQTIGNSQRYASLDTLAYPDAMLGAFFFESQVTRYFQKMDYKHMTSLACSLHNGDHRKLHYGVMVWANKLPLGEKPSEQMIKCALLNARTKVFLALDALLINYQVRPVEGRHYPKDEPGHKYDAFQLPQRPWFIEADNQENRGRGRGRQTIRGDEPFINSPRSQLMEMDNPQKWERGRGRGTHKIRGDEQFVNLRRPSFMEVEKSQNRERGMAGVQPTIRGDDQFMN